MQSKIPVRGLIAALLVLSAAPGATAQKSRAGQFDYYMLSLSIAPSFCATTPVPSSKPECPGLTETQFEQTPLTIHGLWPNLIGVADRQQPQSCSNAPLVIPPALQPDLARYMPGGIGLQQHEWPKHGTCSGLSAGAYFQAEIDLAKSANATIGAAILEGGMIGQHILIADLVNAVSAKDATVAAAIVADCSRTRAGGDTVVGEIRLTLAKDTLLPIAASSVGLRQAGNCPNGAGLVPAVSN